MIFTTKMTQFLAVVLDRDMEKVTEEMLRQGVIQFIGLTELFDEQKSKTVSFRPSISLSRFSEIKKRIESYLQLSESLQEINYAIDLQSRKPVDFEVTEEIFSDIEADLHGLRDRQNDILKKITKSEHVRGDLMIFRDINTEILAPARHSHITVHAGTLPVSKFEAFLSSMNATPFVKHVIQEEDQRISLILITMKQDDDTVKNILGRHEWADMEISEDIAGLGESDLSGVEAGLSKLYQERDTIDSEIREIIEKKRELLESMWINLNVNELFHKIQSYFGATSSTIMFSGWLPVSNRKTIEKAIVNITGGRCYLEWNDPVKLENSGYKNMEAPVQLKNPGFLSPFQWLVQNFSIPEYGTIDPTLFLAISYLIMFGLMFGDAGHGAVLALAGITGSIMFKDRSAAYYTLSKLIIWCGAFAMITGVLFGEYFGTKWLKPLWIDYAGIVEGHAVETGFIRDINGLLSLTIYFGIFIIGFGLILSLINKIRQRKWRELAFDKGGILGGWMYCAGVYTALYFINRGYTELPPAGRLFWLLGAPSIMLLLNPLMEYLPVQGEKPHSKFTVFALFELSLTWAVELLDIFSGFLSNTLSFMRIAGYGIAHISLMAVIFDFARSVGGGGSTYTGWSYIILIFGNILVISLEGLLAGVQSLRLNYYEFFTKFFRTGGKVYSPISLSSRD